MVREQIGCTRLQRGRLDERYLGDAHGRRIIERELVRRRRVKARWAIPPGMTTTTMVLT
jgi:hypothetical protein